MFAVEWEEKGRHYWENALTQIGLEMIIEKLIEEGIIDIRIKVIED